MLKVIVSVDDLEALLDGDSNPFAEIRLRQAIADAKSAVTVHLMYASDQYVLTIRAVRSALDRIPLAEAVKLVKGREVVFSPAQFEVFKEHAEEDHITYYVKAGGAVHA